MFEKENPKIQLSNEAAEKLNELLMDYFTIIASKAAQIIKRASKDDVSNNDVRKIVGKVMKGLEKPKKWADCCVIHEQ